MDKPTAPKVSDLMTSEVTSLYRNDELTLADDIMRLGRIRHLPVLDEQTDELVGVLSGRDLYQSALVKALGYGAAGHRKVLKTLRVKEIMTNDPATVTPDTPLADAAQLMLEKKLGCLPVVSGSKLVGILTEADFVALAIEDVGDA